MKKPEKDEDLPRKGWREAFEKEKDRELTQEDLDFINMPSESQQDEEEEYSAKLSEYNTLFLKTALAYKNKSGSVVGEFLQS